MSRTPNVSANETTPAKDTAFAGTAPKGVAGSLDDADWLRDAYITRGMTLRQIATAVGAGSSSVSRALQRHKIPTRIGKPPPAQRGILDDADWLRARYETDGLSFAAIADLSGSSARTVGHALRKHGIALRPAPGPRPPSLDDPEWLREQYETRKRSMQDIGAIVGCTANAVLAAMHRHGIPLRPPRPTRPPELDDPAWLQHHYWAIGMSLKQIGETIGCTGFAVRAALLRHGLGTRPGPNRIDELADHAWLWTEYMTHGRTVEQIAQHLGCAATTVRQALYRAGIEAGQPWTHPAVLDDPAWLQEHYVKQQRSLNEIGRMTGVDPKTVRKALKIAQIPLRPTGTGSGPATPPASPASAPMRPTGSA